MTINVSDNSPRINYSATSGQTSFPVPFVFFDSGDLNVYINGVLKSFSTDYTVAGGDNGTGSITLLVGATLSDKVAITRDVPLGRSTDLTPTYSAPAINDQLDTIIAQIADIDDKASRAIQLTDYEVGAAVSLPSIDARKGKTIQFNSTTGDLEVGPSGDDLTSIGSVTSEIASLAGISGTLTSLGGYVTEINAVGDNIASVIGVNAGLTNVNTVASGIANVASVATSIADVNDVSDSLGEISLVSAKLGNIDTVAIASANIGTVAGSIAQVNTVAGISSSVSTVAGLSAAIGTVNTNAADIAVVSASIDDVNDVAVRITDVTSVSAALTNIGTVASISGNISTVAGISSAVSTVSGLSGAIATVNSNATDISTAAGVSSNISSVAGSIASVNIVAPIAANVTTVAGSSADVSTVAGSIGNVNSVAAEIGALVNIQDSVTAASVSAAAASVDADDAQAAATETLGYRDTASLHKLAAEAAATSATNTAAALTGFDLEAIAANKAVTAVDVFVYDTSKDSDGGAWRKRTQGTSWYQETLNTATRGSRREFPSVAVIVAETSKLTIYDGDDPALPMWMVFTAATDHSRLVAYGDGGYVSCAYMLNGTLFIGTYSGTANGSVTGLSVANFVADSQSKYDETGYIKSPFGLYDRNNATHGLWWHSTLPRTASQAIISQYVNDVAMTVLPDAPIDAATGLPVPTIRVGTAGGMSVIENDGTVTSTASSVYSQSTSDSPDYDLWQRYNFGRSLFGGGSIYAYMSSSWYLVVRDSENNILDSWGIGDKSEGAPVYLRLTQIAFDPTGAKQHLSCGMTATYCSGWMPALIKGAFLSDTDTTSLVVEDYSKTLVLGDFVISTGNVDITDLGDRFRITRNAVAGTAAQSYVDLAVASLTVGATYFAEFEILATGASNNAYTGATHGGATSFISSGYTTGNTVRNNFAVATGAGTGGLRPFFSVSRGSSPASSIEGDWIEIAKTVTLELADADRSVNNNGLIVNGTITRAPVATGAELVAYSGFSATNYLEQPYNADLDFGTGDFCVMGWVKLGSSPTQYVIDRQDGVGGTTDRLNFAVTNTRSNLFCRIDNTTVTVAKSLPENVWLNLVLVRKSGVAYFYVDGSLVGSGAQAGDATDASASFSTTILGQGTDRLSNPTAGALLRISATAPTAEQIAKIYNDEKYLFQDNAACTLYGTSDAVTALAHDSATDLLHVGTSAGRSVFDGLRRVSNTTAAVGTAISASNGLVVEE